MSQMKLISEVQKDTLRSLTLDDIENAYNGNQGCACGCGGDYATPANAPRKVQQRLNKLIRNIDSLIVIDGEKEIIFCLEGESRATRVYAEKATS